MNPAFDIKFTSMRLFRIDIAAFCNGERAGGFGATVAQMNQPISVSAIDRAVYWH